MRLVVSLAARLARVLRITLLTKKASLVVGFVTAKTLGVMSVIRSAVTTAKVC